MMKPINKYYISVEGQTEFLYLNHLVSLINASNVSTHRVSIHIKINRPTSFVKKINVLQPVKIYHFCDIESLSDEHLTKFHQVISDIASAKQILSNRVKSYELLYSNFTFELWILLHKQSVSTHLNHRKEYLEAINKAFIKKYVSLDEFKKEKNFIKILNKITLNDVIKAIERANIIMQHNQNNYVPKQYKKIKYFEENPSLEVHKLILLILKNSGIITK